MIDINLSANMIGIAVISGIILSLIYFTLLWYTTQNLPKIKNKGLFLFLSSIMRLTLFAIVAILLILKNPTLFLWLFVGFVGTRSILVPFLNNKGKTC